MVFPLKGVVIWLSMREGRGPSRKGHGLLCSPESGFLFIPAQDPSPPILGGVCWVTSGGEAFCSVASEFTPGGHFIWKGDVLSLSLCGCQRSAKETKAKCPTGLRGGATDYFSHWCPLLIRPGDAKLQRRPVCRWARSSEVISLDLSKTAKKS